MTKEATVPDDDATPADTTPADTTMMRIVHAALRRDLRRARTALAADPAPDHRQCVAIAEHLHWMMGFLEAHHRSEDEGLYPLVRRRDPAAAVLLDDMAADHRAVAVATSDVEQAADLLRRDDDTRAAIEAIDQLTNVLLPHLDREEREAMPLVSRTITDAEWQRIEQEHNLDGQSLADLGRAGHWLIDGVSDDDRAHVLGLVPAGQRFVLLHGFGRAYRRRARACWSPRRIVQKSGSTAVVVDAPLADVWEVVRDPTRVGEWSHECIGGSWVGGATEARPGARFRGRNRQGLVRWGRLCEVLSVEEHQLVWQTVPTRLYPDSTVWRLDLSAVDDGTRIEQSFQVVKGSILEPIYAVIAPAHRDRTEALERDLERIGAVAGARGGAGVEEPRAPERHGRPAA